jgi:hypothetical protein
MRKLLSILIVLAATLAVVSCHGHDDDDPDTSYTFGSDLAVTKQIRKVRTFPTLPDGFLHTDYAAMARALDALAFSFSSDPVATLPSYGPDPSTWEPLGFWDDGRVGIPPSVTTVFYKDRTFGFPTYVGDRRSSSEGPYEAITMLPMVLGASYAGIDKSDQTIGGVSHNFVDMTKAFFDVGIGLVLNTTSNTVQGKSFWYDLYPQITIARLSDLYPDDEDLKMIVRAGADTWLDALPHMVDTGVAPDYAFTGFDVRFNVPVMGPHIEPPNGGLAFIFYAAWRMTGEQMYLEGAKTVLDWLEDTPRNPNYEAMNDFAFLVAAALNLTEGTDYDVQKMIEFVFENDAAYRPGWSVLSGDFNGYPVHGLVGDQSYAFAMNSFNLASTLVPTVKYDVRFADDVGTYVLNLVNNARWFMPEVMPLVNQTMTARLAIDPEGVIIYEGLKRSIGDISPVAAGDATSMFSQPSDLSLYSSSHLGYLGGIVRDTDVHGILEIDLDATDSFGDHTFPVHLYKNPYTTRRVITVDVGSGSHDLFDAVTKRIVARDVTGQVEVDIPANGSRVLWTLPANSTFTREGDTLYVDGVAVASWQAAVNIVSPGNSSYTLTEGDVIRLSTFAPAGDTITRMVVRYGDIVVHDGPPLETIDYDKSQLPDTDYDLVVEIWTQQGLYDRSTSRVICR